MPNEHLPSPESPSGTGLPRVLTRWFGPGSGRNTDRFYTVLFVIAVVLVGAGVNLWPHAVPSLTALLRVSGGVVATLRSRVARRLRADPGFLDLLDVGLRA